MQILYGFILGLVIAVLAYLAGALSLSGAAAAAITGGLIFGLGGLPWAVLLLLFFISSSALSKAFRRRKYVLNEKFAKGSRRDWSQVAANGGLGALLALALAVFPGQAWPWYAFAGAMAAVNADTWATELGVLSLHPPRLITTGKVAERGTSGAISWTGTLAAAGGAALVGLAAGLLTATQVKGGGPSALMVLILVALAGLGGSLFDSLLGATVQAIYWCPACQKETERHPLHLCGTPTTQMRGWSWVSNEVVNFGCSLVGAVLAVGLVLLFL